MRPKHLCRPWKRQEESCQRPEALEVATRRVLARIVLAGLSSRGAAGEQAVVALLQAPSSGTRAKRQQAKMISIGLASSNQVH